MTGFIEAGTPCSECFIPMMRAEDKPTVVDTADRGQVTAHWDCLPKHVQEQIKINVKKEKARWN